MNFVELMYCAASVERMEGHIKQSSTLKVIVIRRFFMFQLLSILLIVIGLQ